MIYAIEALTVDRVKIGFTKNDATLHRRLGAIRVDSPAAVCVLGVLRDGSWEQEQELHTLLLEYHSHGEWFVKSLVWPEIGEFFETWNPPKAIWCEGYTSQQLESRRRRKRVANMSEKQYTRWLIKNREQKRNWRAKSRGNHPCS